jgi:hypothetical protein
MDPCPTSQGKREEGSLMAWKEKKWDSKIAKKLKKKVNGN